MAWKIDNTGTVSGGSVENAGLAGCVALCCVTATISLQPATASHSFPLSYQLPIRLILFEVTSSSNLFLCLYKHISLFAPWPETDLQR